MIDLNKSYDRNKEDIQSVNDWCDNAFDKSFSEYFKESELLFERLKSEDRPITDTELEYILMTIPMHLYSASETLNKFKIHLEIIKLNNKKKEADLMKESDAKTASQKKADAQIQMLDDTLLETAYTLIISRVESSISMSKELIMGAKKIWDGRRKSEQSMPVSEIDPDNIPTYQKNQYIK